MYIVKCFSVSVFHNLCLSEMLDGLLSSFTSISYLIKEQNNYCSTRFYCIQYLKVT